MDRSELERLDRERLVFRAQAAGIKRARLLTRPELIDELLRRDPVVDEGQLKRSRGFFGVARDLLSRVVERGLHLPDAADRLRAALGNPLPQVPRPEPQAVPTVTLAEIYASQGHKARAIETLRRVLEAEPEHGGARALLERLEAADYVPPPPPELPPEVEPRDREADPAVDEAAVETAEAGVGSDPEAVLVTGEMAPPAAAVSEPLVSTVDAAPPSDQVPTVEPKTTAWTPPAASPPAASSAADARPSECYAVPTPAGYFVWWRLSDAAKAVAQAGSFVVRAVVIFPTWDGPRTDSRDVRADAGIGETVLHGLPGRAVVRIGVGVLPSGGGDFIPLAHSPAIEAAPAELGGGLVRWSLEGVEPMTFPDAKLGERVRRALVSIERST